MTTIQMATKRTMRAAAIFAAATLPASALAQTELYHVEGTTPGSNFGLHVATVGDVDLDGAPDFLVGAPADGYAASYAGRAALHSGVSGHLLHEWFGTDALGFLGSAVASAGDVNGDAIPDLLVGALGATNPATGRATGAVSLYSGADGSLLRNDYGRYDGEDFGAALANLGDVDGDGYDDYVVGAPGADDLIVDGGAAYLYSGLSGKYLGSAVSGGKNNMLGWGVAALGDIDHDGRGDFAAGLPFRDGHGISDSGVIWIYSGANLQFLFAILGDQIDLNLGYAMAGGHDLDGDGTPDLLVGLPNASGFYLEQGAVRAYSGVDGTLLWERVGTKADDHLGEAVAMADTDGDGTLELLVTAGRLADPHQRVELATAAGSNLSTLYTWVGAQLDDGLGASLAVLGDVDGDAFVDFALGSPRSDNGGFTHEGFVRVQPGRELWLNADPKEAGAGATLTTTIRTGAVGRPTLRFVTDVNGSPLFFGLPPLATFDAQGSVLFSETVPPGLAGLTVTLRAYAVRASGKLVATNDETIELL